jgi:hypothetical protein
MDQVIPLAPELDTIAVQQGVMEALQGRGQDRGVI